MDFSLSLREAQFRNRVRALADARICPETPAFKEELITGGRWRLVSVPLVRDAWDQARAEAVKGAS